MNPAPSVPASYDYRLIPIVIGVTGHRDIPLEDTDKIRDAIKKQLAKLRENYPHTPVYLLSALAEGADRIAAEAALAIPRCALGAVLPMPAAEYEKDFADPESLAEFRALCDRAAFVHTVDPPASNPEDRAQYYLELGLYIARQSQILIALWDGVDLPNKPGGTSDVVKIFKEGNIDAIGTVIPLPEPGPVIHIKTRREQNICAYLADQVGQVVEPCFLSEESTICCDEITECSDKADREKCKRQTWRAMLSNIENFNLDAQAESSSDPELKTFMKIPLPERCWLSSGIYYIADKISYQTQMRRRKFLYLILGLALLAIFSEQVFTALNPKAHGAELWMALTLIGGLTAWFLYDRGKCCRLEDCYLDYRALAEASRVQIFWKLAGLDDRVANYYLRGQSDELEWVRQAVRSQELPIGKGANLTDLEQAEGMRQALRLWIGDQKLYFLGKKGGCNGKIQQHRRSDKRWSRRSRWLFIAAVLTTIAAMLGRQYPIPNTDCGQLLNNILQVTYNVLFALAGIARVYQEVMGFAEQANSYQKVGFYYQQAEMQLEKALDNNDLKRAQAIIRRMGEYALDENEEWLIVHRNRPLSVPVG